jgi:zinc and cadmium transporter
MQSSSYLLICILLGTLASGVGSVWVAWIFVKAVMSKYTQHLLSLAAGALLATAFMHLLPEAFEGFDNPRALFGVLLAGILFFFLLDKAELWHHGHEHHHDSESTHDSIYSHQHAHSPGHAHTHLDSTLEPHLKGGGWAVLFGDSLHSFGDGVLVAAAFMADFHVGLIASLAVWTHEVPHHMGDLVVLGANSTEPKTAIIKLSLAGGVTVLGGLAGLFLLRGHEDFLPYLLALASSSYIYVSLADLIPQLQKRLTPRQTLTQLIWLSTGLVLVSLASQLGRSFGSS